VGNGAFLSLEGFGYHHPALFGLDIGNDHVAELDEPRAGGRKQYDQPPEILIERKRCSDDPAHQRPVEQQILVECEDLPVLTRKRSGDARYAQNSTSAISSRMVVGDRRDEAPSTPPRALASRRSRRRRLADGSVRRARRFRLRGSTHRLPCPITHDRNKCSVNTRTAGRGGLVRARLIPNLY
jgi:hypothetical protein